MGIETITVIGENGTIGAQVAGLLAAFLRAKVYCVSRTMEKSLSGIERAVKSVRADSIRPLLVPETFDHLGVCIQNSDWEFESVAEDYQTKLEVNKMIATLRQPGTIVSTGTSGLSISKLSEAFDKEGKSLYFGTHFFNPPYALPLLEFVTTEKSDPFVANQLVQLLEDKVLRKVVRVKDKAGFLGNRIGFIFMNEVAQYAEKYQDRGGVDYMDAILGCFTGRAMPPLTTVDFVGLDVHQAIINHLHEEEPDFFGVEQSLPPFLLKLLSEKKYGRKAGEGFYKMNEVKQQLVYDISSGQYRPLRDYRLNG